MDVKYQAIFDIPAPEFRKHFENTSNSRVLFSGRFGSGKTEFLKWFFSEENQIAMYGSKKYEVYHLFPVNYSVGSNEDIFSYIKYDLICELLAKGKQMDPLSFSFTDVLPDYLGKNYLKLIASVLKMTPEVGREISEVFEALLRDLRKYHKEINVSEGDKLVEFLESLESNKGLIFEKDIISRIIAKQISNSEGVLPVLILDDVDRLDPEHVFRMLNIFAAHYESRSLNENGNKYGFHKVAIVCDVENLKRIFAHRYGTGADFSGYIDKFFNTEVYHFSNKEAVLGILSRVYNGIKFSKLASPEEEGVVKDIYFKNKFIARMLLLFLQNGTISLRGLMKIAVRDVDFHYNELKGIFGDPFVYRYWQFPILLQLRMLSAFLSDKDDLSRGISECKRLGQVPENHDLYFANMLFVLHCIVQAKIPSEACVVRFENESIVAVPRFEARTEALLGVQLFKHIGMETPRKPALGDKYDSSVEQFWSLFDLLSKTLVWKQVI